MSKLKQKRETRDGLDLLRKYNLNKTSQGHVYQKQKGKRNIKASLLSTATKTKTTNNQTALFRDRNKKKQRKALGIGFPPLLYISKQPSLPPLPSHAVKYNSKNQKRKEKCMRNTCTAARDIRHTPRHSPALGW